MSTKTFSYRIQAVSCFLGLIVHKTFSRLVPDIRSTNFVPFVEQPWGLHAFCRDVMRSNYPSNGSKQKGTGVAGQQCKALDDVVLAVLPKSCLSHSS